MLEELYYTFGRYLLISCSRGMDTPANLQGIWNNSDRPAWQCDIHSNINVQMNYWPAEVTNLSRPENRIAPCDFLRVDIGWRRHLLQPL